MRSQRDKAKRWQFELSTIIWAMLLMATIAACGDQGLMTGTLPYR